MAEPFTIGIAGLTADLHPLYEYSHHFCREYLVPAPEGGADIRAVSSPQAIAAEQEAGCKIPDDRAEPLCLYRQIAERLPAFDGFVFHGAAIEYEKSAYLFTAPSGTGKSTHIRLWQQYLGEKVAIVNGDKPVLRLSENGVNVCSTPWAGKEGWQRNCIVPLGGWCILRRGETDRIQRADPAQCLDELLHQVYLPKNGAMLGRTLELLDQVCRRVPLFILECTMKEDAVRTAFEAMTGNRYKGGSV